MTSRGPMKQGPNIYTVETVILSIVGVAWMQGFQTLSSSFPLLDNWAFPAILVAAVVDLFLCTVMDARVVQRQFMAFTMGVTACYVYVACQILTPAPSNLSLNSTVPSLPDEYTTYFMGGGTGPLTPLNMAVSLAILVIQTLVAAAAISPYLWETPAVWSTVMIGVFLVSPLRTCSLATLVIFIIFATLEVATQLPREIPVRVAHWITTIALVVQFGGFVIRLVFVCLLHTSMGVSFITIGQGALGQSNSTGLGQGALISMVLFLWIPTIVSLVSLGRVLWHTLVAWGLVDGNIHLFPPSEGSSTALPPGPPSVQRAADPSTLQASRLQSAFYTSEAKLFSPELSTSLWGTKKTT